MKNSTLALILTISLAVMGITTLSSSGNVVEETFYEPYGDVDSGGTADVKLYLAEFSDSLTGQYLFGDRYFNPEWGRVIQPDDYLSYYNPQGLNRYSYALNNPYKYKDDSGESPTLVLGAIGAVVGGGINLGVQLWQNNGDLSKVDYGSLAVSAGAGFIVGATLGLATPAVSAAVSLVGPEAALGTVGALSAVEGQATTNLLTGEELTEGLGEAAEAGYTGGLIGGAAGGVISGAGRSANTNPWGRHGSPAHQATVAKEAASLSKNGWTIKAGGGILPEKRVKIPVQGNYRYPDIIAGKSGQDLYVNIGRATSSGNPVSREAQALSDLTKTGKSTKFVPYKSACRATGNARCH